MIRTSGKKKSFQIGTAFWIATITSAGRASSMIEAHDAKLAGAIHARRFFSSRGRCAGTGHDEDGGRNAHRDIDKDEAEIAVDQSQRSSWMNKDDRQLQRHCHSAEENISTSELRRNW